MTYEDEKWKCAGKWKQRQLVWFGFHTWRAQLDIEWLTSKGLTLSIRPLINFYAIWDNFLFSNYDNDELSPFKLARVHRKPITQVIISMYWYWQNCLKSDNS